MVFAKIENNICINAVVFNSVEEAMAFDSTLIELPENYGIGDKYDGEWIKKVKTEKEINKHKNEIRTKEIKEELSVLDSTINRATEDLYSLTNTTPYQTTLEVINKKEELRKELQTLTKVGE